MGGSCCAEKIPEEECFSEMESTIKNKHKYDKNKTPTKGALKCLFYLFHNLRIQVIKASAAS